MNELNVWDLVKYFKKYENWGDFEKMNPLLLIVLEYLRAKAGNPFVIHTGYKTKGHSTKSQHYKGNAVDFHIKNLSLFEGYKLILEGLKEIGIHNSCGLGFYPEWNNKGFHLDIRRSKVRWYRKNGEYIYLTEAKAFEVLSGITTPAS